MITKNQLQSRPHSALVATFKNIPRWLNKPDYTMSSQDILGISSNATKKEIKTAYRKASLKTHPDVKGGSKEAFNKVNDAYNTLINSSNSSRVNPYGRGAMRHRDGSYNNETTTRFGSRATTNANTFHTPNPYRWKTASSIKGSQQTMGTYHHDERLDVQYSSKSQLRAQVLKQSQRTHTRRNFWVCTLPLVAAYAAYEYNIQQRHSALRSRHKAKRKRKKKAT